MRYWDGGQELYDTTRSQWQEENLVTNRRYGAVLSQLRTLQTALSSCQGTEECNPPASVPPAPAAQYHPRFVATLNRWLVHAAGDGSFRIQARISGGGLAVDRGTVRMLADGKPVGATAKVTTYGWGTVKVEPTAIEPARDLSTHGAVRRRRQGRHGRHPDTAVHRPHPLTARHLNRPPKTSRDIVVRPRH